MNGVYIRALGTDELAERLLPYLLEAGVPAEIDEVRRAAPLVQERIVTLGPAVEGVDPTKAAVELLRFLWSDVDPAVDDLVPKKMDAGQTAEALAAVERALSDLADWEAEPIEAALRAVAEALGLKPGPAFQPVRVAITGSRVAPPLFESLEVLGRERSQARLAAARARLAAAATEAPPEAAS
jgi:glutamyl-tRNA synthetase